MGKLFFFMLPDLLHFEGYYIEGCSQLAPSKSGLRNVMGTYAHYTQVRSEGVKDYQQFGGVQKSCLVPCSALESLYKGMRGRG